MKLLAVDGNSILNRAYYGIRPLTTKDGIYTNAIYGFLTILQKMLQETKPDAVAVTFDMRAPTFRHKMYDGYKAQRKGMPEELAQQLPLLQELLPYLGFPVVMCEGYEADDLLGTLARGTCEEQGSCIIATGDRDSFQLISDCVSVRLASTKGGRPQADIYDTAAIREKYSLTPDQLIDLKALMGDASDNIPGVAGVGEKTALALMQQYGSLDYIYQNLDELEIRDSVRQKLRAGQEMALLSRELATIDRHAPIDEKPSSYALKKPDNPQAYGLMKRLELFSLMEKFGIRPESGAAEAQEAETQEAPPLEIRFGAPLSDWLQQDATHADVLFAFGDDGALKTICAIGPDALFLYDQGLDATAREILTAPVPKRTNGAKQLHRYAISHGFDILNLDFDVEIAAYILNPTANDYSLSRLAQEYAVVPTPVADLFGDWGTLLEDCACFTALADLLSARISDNAQHKLLHEIELPLARVLADMELAGIAVDREGLIAYGEKIDEQIAYHQNEIYELAGEKFNVNSPKQLGVILFDKLGLPAKKKTKTGYSTNADVLESLAGQHAIVQHILDFRQVAKLKSTYVDGLLREIGPDGRIHTIFQQTLTRTGRISSTEPNLQNIPIRTELGSELRRFFRASGDNILLDADYSQIELRVLAHIAEDINMIEAFRAGEDIHTNTAAQVFDMPPGMVTPLMRSRAKAVNFGIVYGMGAFSLSQDIGVPVSEADKYIKQYLANFSGVREYMEETVRFGTEHGYVKTLLGRRRYLPELSSKNRPMREFGKRVAMNTPIQGTAADIIKIAMVRVYNRLKKENLTARLILQVHDELIVECPPHEKEQATALLQEEMERAVELSVPLEAQVGSGGNWLEAK